MANRTDPLAKTVKGTNPQNQVEKIIRNKIYQSMYWKEHCFALTAESLVDKAVDIRKVGGTFGGTRRPSEFLCLILKMLQIQPDKDIIREYILQYEEKYLMLLGAFYLRLTGSSVEIYQYLEPLYNDLRKVRLQKPDGTLGLSHVDELVEAMIYKDYLFDINLPQIPKRQHLVEQGLLNPFKSFLNEEFDEEALAVDAKNAQQQVEDLQHQIRKQRDLERDKENQERRRYRERSRSRSGSYDRSRRRHRSYDQASGSRSRSRSRSKERDLKKIKKRNKDKIRDKPKDKKNKENKKDKKRQDRSRSRSREKRRK